VDTNRMSQGQLVAGLSAIALFIISFLPWFGISGGVIVEGVGAVGGSENFNLWQAENPLDIYLLIVIVVAVVPALFALAGGGAEAPLAPFATALLGGVGTLLILYQLFDTPGDLDRKVGLWLGLVACAGIAVGGYLAMQEDMRRERY
jgi:hypothetical protein